VLKDAWRANNDEARLPDRDRGLDYGTSARAGAKAATPKEARAFVPSARRAAKHRR
jgi:hypothetical protein